MWPFKKKEYDIIEMPFYLDCYYDPEASEEALFVDLAFYGDYNGNRTLFRVTFQYYDEEHYDEMKNFLALYEHNVPVKIKVNKAKINDFRVDIDYMAEVLGNPAITRFELICYGAFQGDAAI